MEVGRFIKAVTGYDVGKDPPEARDVKYKEAKVGRGEEEDEKPCNSLKGVPGAVPPIPPGMCHLLHGQLHIRHQAAGEEVDQMVS